MKDLLLKIGTCAVAMLALCAVTAFILSSPAEASVCLTLGAVGLGFLLKDKLLRTVHALPNGAATTNGAGLDLGLSTRSEFVAECEAVVTSPALTVGELANGDTITYHLYHDTAVGFGTETLLATLGVVTGAGGVGAVAAEFRGRLPTTTKRYLRLKTVKTGTGNATTKNGTLELAF